MEIYWSESRKLWVSKEDIIKEIFEEKLASPPEEKLASPPEEKQIPPNEDKKNDLKN